VADKTHLSKLGAGAAETAPTSPHATPRALRGKATGPERFWSAWRVRLALAFGFVGSVGFHYAVGPWSLFPEEHLEFREVDGELTIPIEAMMEEPAAPTPAAAPPDKASDTPGAPGHAKNGPDAGPREEDGGGGDATAHDGGDAGDLDGDVATLTADAAALATNADGGVIPGSNGPRDPTGMVGVAGGVQAGPSLVQLLVNMEVIRQNPTGAKMGPLLSAIPQWDDFMSGTQVDPIRDTDWVFITGPSLIHTERDAIMIHYSTSDAVVDKAIDIVAHKYDRGGLFDAGVPGVKATLGHADRAQRVFLRPQPHLLAVVPPDYANTAARMLKGAKVSAHVRPGEAVRLTLQNPSRPMPFLPTSISELRLWVIPRAADGGADVFAEGDCPDSAAAILASEDFRRFVTRQNSIGVRIVTQGLLNNVEISPDGSLVRLHLSVSFEQLETILGLVAGQLGVAAPAGSSPPTPPPHR
jgi:hypothetical protein